MTSATQFCLRRVIALLLTVGCAVSVAAPADEGGLNAQALDAQALDTMRGDLTRFFTLDNEQALDPALRSAANAMSAAHLARFAPVLSAWIKEERALHTAKGGPLRPSELYGAVYARMLNELALWHMAQGDADYERATLEVIKTAPRICDRSGDLRFADFTSRIVRLQAMPAAQRSAALATEQHLLARWGKAWTAPPPLPSPLPQDAAQEAARQALKRPQTEPQHATLAMSPYLAGQLLMDRKDSEPVHANTQCALQQWWLRERLRTGATPAAVLTDFRYGTLISAGDRFGGEPPAPPAAAKSDAGAGTPAYPQLASRFGVEGVTTVRIQKNAAGKIERVSVVERKIAVPGIRGVRPLAFETVFDPVSVDYARRGQLGKPGSPNPATFELVWKMETETGKTTTGAGQ